MNVDSLKKLYVHELKDIWSAEHQAAEALPALIDSAGDDGLAVMLRGRLDDSRTRIGRIEKIFEGLEFAPGGHRCKGMSGLIAEGKDLLDDAESDVVDAAIVSSCQRMAHYEMAAYGVARAFAGKLGRKLDVGLLTQSIEESGTADRALTQLAEHHINFLAAVAS